METDTGNSLTEVDDTAFVLNTANNCLSGDQAGDRTFHFISHPSYSHLISGCSLIPTTK